MVAYNPLGRPVTSWFRLPVTHTDYEVLDSNLKEIPSQVWQCNRQVLYGHNTVARGGCNRIRNIYTQKPVLIFLALSVQKICRSIYILYHHIHVWHHPWSKLVMDESSWRTTMSSLSCGKISCYIQIIVLFILVQDSSHIALFGVSLWPFGMP